MEVGIEFWIAASLSAFLLGGAKGGLSIAGALVVPVMSLVMSPVAGAGLLLPLFLLSDIYAIWLFRGSYSAVNLKTLIPAGLFGVCAGFVLVSYISENTAKLMVAAVGIWYLANTVCARIGQSERPIRPATIPGGLFWGTLSGITSYISHAGGPPFQTYVLPQKLPKLVFAGTATIFFALVNFAKLPAYVVAGQVTVISVEKVLILGPIALIGARAGYQLAKIMPERMYFALIEMALGLVSVKLIWDVVLG